MAVPLRSILQTTLGAGQRSGGRNAESINEAKLACCCN